MDAFGLGDAEVDATGGAGGFVDADGFGGGAGAGELGLGDWGGTAAVCTIGASSGRSPHHTAPAARTVRTAQPAAKVRIRDGCIRIFNPTG
jgi:hypothetical protein